MDTHTLRAHSTVLVHTEWQVATIVTVHVTNSVSPWMHTPSGHTVLYLYIQNERLLLRTVTVHVTNSVSPWMHTPTGHTDLQCQERRFC